MEAPHTPVIDAIDMEILMHRDAHFGGNFEVMIEYYEQNGVGVMPDFEVQQIKQLQNLEHELKQDLSDLYLPEPARKIVENSQKLYQSLRDVYSGDSQDKISILISDLILSEEMTPEAEIQVLADQKEAAVPALIHLLSSPSFYEPIFPGYGRAPIFAAKCLGLIQDERAIPPLFEAIGQENFFTDEEIIYALRSFGKHGKAFLIDRLKSQPLSKDNEHAAIALSAFPEDEEIAKSALEVLQYDETLKRPTLATYLIFACHDLTDVNDQQAFINVSKKDGTPKVLLEEMQVIIRNWKKTT